MRDSSANSLYTVGDYWMRYRINDSITHSKAGDTMEQTSLGYTVKALADISKQEIPANFRLARIIRKASAKDSNGMESQGVMVPAVVADAAWLQSDTIRAYMEQCIADVQDKIVRKVTDSGRNIITDVDINMDAVASYLEATDDNIGRLSRDKIGQWFDAEALDTLTLAFANKMGVGNEPTAEQVTKLEQVTRQYRDCFGMLAGKSPSVAPKVGENLLKALDMIPATAFSLRLAGITKAAMVQVEPDMMGL